MLRRAHAARDQVVERLSQAQFVAPHTGLRNTLLGLEPGEDPAVIEAALVWLRLDPMQAIGRLRRTELVQLARCFDRMKRQQATARVG